MLLIWVLKHSTYNAAPFPPFAWFSSKLQFMILVSSPTMYTAPPQPFDQDFSPVDWFIIQSHSRSLEVLFIKLQSMIVMLLLDVYYKDAVIHVRVTINDCYVITFSVISIECNVTH